MNLLVVLANHYLKTKKEYKNVRKQDDIYQDVFIKRN